jgi:hypothetical protein
MTTITTTITAAYYPTFASDNPLTIATDGAISFAADSAFALYLSPDDWFVENDGLIAETGPYGLGVALKGGTLLNNGSIVGGGYGVIETGGGDTIVNTGRISETGTKSYYEAVLVLSSTLALTNAVGGTIAGETGVEMRVGGDLTVVNSGLVTGSTGVVIDAGTLSLTNAAHGTIAGISSAVDLGSSTATVVNQGSIQAAGIGVTATKAGVLIDNAAGGTIASYRPVQILGGTVINAGVLIPNGMDAVTFAPGSADRVVAYPGAMFLGDVAGGNTIGATASSTLEFAAGTGAGTFSGLGSHYTQFAAIEVDAGAAWTASGGNTLGAGYVLADHGMLTVAGTLSGAGMVTLGVGVTLDVAAGGVLGEAVTGLVGGTIELLGSLQTYSAFAGGMLTLSGGTTLDLPGVGHVDVTEGGGDTFITACFASRTGIATARGRVAVEALLEGDLVFTATGRLAPVRWIGRRRTDLRRHPSPHDVMPVRVTAGAFGPSLPSKDLCLSPDHAVFVAGALVPVRHLINGVSIVQEARDHVTYWHVELDRHDVILAEDLPCESFLDTGNRCAFDNAPGAVAMTPDFARAVWDERGCAPILTDRRDPRLRALHTRLLARAVDVGVAGLERVGKHQ